MDNLRAYDPYNLAYSDDIAEKLKDILSGVDVDLTDKERKELEESIFYLKCCADNHYNSDHFRTFYNVLSAIALGGV